MDLEALTSEQLEMTLKLSDILSMEDLTVAAAVLSSFDWNIEVNIIRLRKPPNNFKSAQYSLLKSTHLLTQAPHILLNHRNSTTTMSKTKTKTFTNRTTPINTST